MSRFFSIRPRANRRLAAVSRPHVRIVCESLEDRTAPALFNIGSPQSLTGLRNNGFVTSGDWNGDGNRDIVMTNYGESDIFGNFAPGQTITFAYGNGGGGFSGPSSLAVGSTSDMVTYLAVGQMNTSDNFIDIVTVQTSKTNQAGSITVFKGTAVGTFAKVANFPISSGGDNVSCVGIADFNGDGNQDVAVVNMGNTTTAQNRNISIFKGDGNYGLTLFNKMSIPDADGVPTALAVAKIDVGNTFDLAVTFANVPPDDQSPQVEGTMKVYTGGGDFSFTPGSSPGSGGPLPINVTVAEVDGTPGIDIVVANAGDPDANGGYAGFGTGRSAAVFRNDGSGNFGPAINLNVGLKSAFAVSVADFNVDGKQDVAVTDYGTPLGSPGGIAVYLGKTGASFTGFQADANSPYSIPAGSQFAVVDNFDSTPSPDIAVVGDYNRVRTLLNQTVVLAVSTTSLVTSGSPAEYGATVTLTATVAPAAGGGTPTGTVTFFDGAAQIGSPVSLVTVGTDQKASLPWSSFTAGSHTLTAKYNGDAAFSASTSGAVNQAINPATTTTTITGPGGSVAYGSPANFSAFVAALVGVPTGTVEFYDGASKIGTATLYTNGGGQQQADYAATGLTTGSHSITAKYVATANFAASTSNPPFALTVDPVSTTTTLAGPPGAVEFGSAAVLSATVSSGGPPPTGTVEFYENTTKLGTGTLAVVGGQQVATWDAAGLGAGMHSIVAKYAGTTNFTASQSTAFSIQIDPAGTTITVSASPSPSQYTQTVTLTGTVSSAAGSPTGLVEFYDGATKLGTGNLSTVSGKQVATFPATALTLGGHTFSAKYVAAGNFAGSTSAGAGHTVNPITTTVTIGASPAPSTVTQSVTISATVGSGFGTPTGTVEFYDGGVKIGTGNLGTVGGQQVATFQTAGLALGGHTLTAKYLGVTGYTASASAGFSHTVNPIGTTITVTGATPSPSLYTQEVTFTAVVGAAFGTPTGTVEFYDGGVKIGTGNLGTVGGQQVATYKASALGLGGHTVTAKFATSGNFAGSASAAFAHTVNPAGTAVTLVSTASPSGYGQSVTFTATVTAQAGVPTGKVNFYDGATQMGSGTISTVGGKQVATFSTAGLSAGTHTVVAKYAGATGYSSSASPGFAQSVNPAGTAIDLTVSPTNLAAGQTMTATAVVSSPAGTPTGTVRFYDGSTLLGFAPLLTNGGQQVATFQTSALSAGSHSVSAKYVASGNYAASATGGVTVTVNSVSVGTSVTLSSAPTPAQYGQHVTFTAAVSAATGTPTGTVTFFDGATKLGTGTLASVGGQQVATFTASGLSVGVHTVTAKYAGSGTFNGSDSAGLSLSVNPAGTTITVNIAPTTLGIGQTMTATATVSSVAGTPTGAVEFYDGTTLIGSAKLAPVGGQQVAVFNTTELALGGHSVSAKYVAAGNYAGSATGAVPVTVNTIGTSVGLMLSPSPSQFGQPITFTATVVAATGTPTGTVAFFDNGVQIGTGTLSTVGGRQVATMQLADLAVGPHAVTAKFAAAGNFAGSQSAPLTQTVSPAAVTVVVSSGSPSSVFSRPVTFSATVDTAAGRPAGTLTFFDGTTRIGSANVAAGERQASVTIDNLAVGSHDITARFEAGGNFAPGTSAAFTQSVSAVPTTITLTISPNPVTVRGMATLTATVDVPAGYAVAPGGSVTFRAGGTVLATRPLADGSATYSTTALPAGTTAVTASYEGDPVTATSSATGQITVHTPSGPPVVLVGEKEFGVGAGEGFPGVARFYNPNGSERYTATVFGGFTGGVRVTSADFNGDGVADLVAGTGPGSATRVVVLDGKTKAQLFAVDPFEAQFTGGVYVTTGDMDGDGRPELVITPDQGGGPRCRVFNGVGVAEGSESVIADFFGIDDPDFRGGARASIGDIDGDGVGDLVVSAGFLGGPRVAGYSGAALAAGARSKVFPDFYAFEETLRNGVFIAAGDIDGDGRAELIAGGGPGGGPRVTAFSGADLAKNVHTNLANFFGGDPDNRGGIRVVARNLDGDNRADIVVGDGTGAGSRVTGYLGKDIAPSGTPPEHFAFDAFAGFTGGVFVG